MVEQIRKDYLLAYTELNLTEDLIQDIVLCQLKPTDLILSQQKLIFKTTQTFKYLVDSFIRKNKVCQTFSPNDLKKLYEKNSEMFYQYMLARYFSAWTGLDQLSILLGPNAPFPSKLQFLKSIIFCP